MKMLDIRIVIVFYCSWINEVENPIKVWLVGLMSEKTNRGERVRHLYVSLFLYIKVVILTNILVKMTIIMYIRCRR